MKKKLTGLSIFILMMVASATFTAFTQQEKNKDKKEKQQKQEKDQDKPDKAQKAQKDNDKGNQDGNNKDKSNQGNNGNEKGKKDNDNSKGNNANSNRNNDNGNKNQTAYGYNWDRESFKDRQKLRKQEKVTLCHKFNKTDEPAVTIRVSANALKAHLDHGDVRGDCPEVDNTRYSDQFLDRRRDYYNDLQESQEQVIYSRSILDYALSRLSSSRLQLADMQSRNLAANEIETKRVAVVELEQNVSTLEILLGAAANLLVNKLQ